MQTQVRWSMHGQVAEAVNSELTTGPNARKHLVKSYFSCFCFLLWGLLLSLHRHGYFRTLLWSRGTAHASAQALQCIIDALCPKWQEYVTLQIAVAIFKIPMHSCSSGIRSCISSCASTRTEACSKPRQVCLPLCHNLSYCVFAQAAGSFS